MELVDPHVPDALFTPPIESVAAVDRVALGILSCAPLASATPVVTVVCWPNVTVPAVLLIVREFTVAGKPLPVDCAAAPL